MNMKKGCFLLILVPVAMVSLSACAASLSRDEAYRVLEAIRLKTTPSDFSEPDSFSIDTAIKQDGSSTSLSVGYSSNKHYFHYKSMVTSLSSSAASPVSSEENWLYIDSYSTLPILISFATKDGKEESLVTKGFFDLSDAIAEWSFQMGQPDIKAKLASYYSDLSVVPQSLESVISSLDSSASESYSSTGSGYLDLSIKTSNKTYVASFKNYLVSENDITEGSSSTKVTYYWNNAKTYYPELTNASNSSQATSSATSSYSS